MGGLLVVLIALVIVSRFVPQLTTVEVSGNAHYSRDDILRLADTAPGDPFFWVIRQRLRKLETDPWILQASVLRRWPDTVFIAVTERRPAVRVGEDVYALDGTPLPHPKPSEREGLIEISGWGGDRLGEALALLRQLEDFEPKVLSYSPAGFAIQLAQSQLFTPNLDALRANWASFVSQEGTRAYVYPWGVSAAHD